MTFEFVTWIAKHIAVFLFLWLLPVPSCLIYWLCFLVLFCMACHQPCTVGFLFPLAGTESPGAVRKIMALTDKVRPHNPKIPVPPVTSPGAGRRGPSSPRHAPGVGHPLAQGRLLPVRLTHESSSVISVGNMPPRKPIRTGKSSATDLSYLSVCLFTLGVAFSPLSSCLLFIQQGLFHSSAHSFSSGL